MTRFKCLLAYNATQKVWKAMNATRISTSSKRRNIICHAVYPKTIHRREWRQRHSPLCKGLNFVTSPCINSRRFWYDFNLSRGKWDCKRSFKRRNWREVHSISNSSECKPSLAENTTEEYIYVTQLYLSETNIITHKEVAPTLVITLFMNSNPKKNKEMQFLSVSYIYGETNSVF